jgi:ketosteroid isomerase-like protein
MQTVRTVLLSCLLAVFGLCVCHAADSDLRTVLEGRYAALKSAMAARDAKQIAALLSDDFVSLDVSGNKKTGDDMIRSVMALPLDPDKVSRTEILSVEADGSKAVVKQRYTMRTVKLAADGAKHAAELTTLSTDVWILKNGVWLLQQTATGQMDYMIDGQTIAHKVR